MHIPVSFSVPVKYDVLFTTNLFDLKNPLLADLLPKKPPFVPKLVAFLDDAVATDSCLAAISQYSDTHLSNYEWKGACVLPGGEAAKTSDTLNAIHDFLFDAEICRHSYVLAVGGGAVLDVVGYGAATCHRGINLIRIPTTVLAQNDAGIGVKNGINAWSQKNALGTFAPPHAVINDSTFLKTLELRDWRAGIAEAIKVALIRDSDFFNWIESHVRELCDRDEDVMQSLIFRCAELHLSQISHSGDPFESGSSRPLDFGHWIGHHLETLPQFDLRHGEAVAIGMAWDSLYSHQQGWLSQIETARILNLLESLGFPLEASVTIHDLEQAQQSFQTHLGGQLTLPMLSKIGQQHDIHHLDSHKYHSLLPCKFKVRL